MSERIERKILAPAKEWLSAEEAAEWMGIPETTFDSLVQDGVLPAGQPITKKTVRWHWKKIVAASDLLPFLLHDKSKIKPEPEKK